ncbi:MAG: Tryptophan--tRNA ligase [Microgenomates bacterium OLB22]|nr:MAG: Tryptophan--tRNA ligase [Microgenomates bacterium OLB22]
MNTSSQPYMRTLAGMRPTNILHIGNYFGSLEGMLELQAMPNVDCYFMVADLHAITTPYNKGELEEYSRDMVALYIAAGLDPKKSTLFIQSHIPAHTELAFLLSSMVSIARLMHLPTYKEKIKQHPDANSLALLSYPALMAADIILYKTTHVPVGLDQEPHLEITRELIRKLDTELGVKLPEPVRFSTKSSYIPSLTLDGKMSKSVPNSYIAISDSFDQIHKKIRAVPTATESGGEMSPGVKLLFDLLSLVSTEEARRYKKDFEEGSLQYSQLKDALADSLYVFLEPIQKKYGALKQDPVYVSTIIDQGTQKASAEAETQLTLIKKAMGF